jgi:hypothetical protein
MSPEEKLNLINTCVKEAKSHSSPSSETRKFMEEIKKVVDNQCIETALLKQQVEMSNKQNTQEHSEIMECLKSINGKIDDLPSKFAGKWVESALKWSIIGLITSLFGIAGYLLDKYVIK